VEDKGRADDSFLGVLNNQSFCEILEFTEAIGNNSEVLDILKQHAKRTYFAVSDDGFVTVPLR